jgi:transposase
MEKTQEPTMEKLMAIAKKHKKTKGRPRLMTEEQLNIVRKMRSSGCSHTAIYHALKETNTMPYNSFQSFYVAYKNR